MFRLGFVLILCVYGVLAYNVPDMDYELEAIDKQFSRGMPGTVTSEGGASECKKDIWILWDNSKSVGLSTFLDKVRPFLKNFISSPQLNVDPDGTHIGIITFSTQKQTRVLLELGEMQTKEALLNYLDRLTYRSVMGDGTRTGMAFKIADEKFLLTSPSNYRPDVSDVVMVFTDGEPVRRRGEDIFGDQYKNRRYGEKYLARDRAQSLRDKEVTVVGLAVGTEDILSRFRDDIKEWSTEGKFFEANTDSLENIMDELISASCTDPGQCQCDSLSTEGFVAQGEKALISWIKPTLKCESNRAPMVQNTEVEPPISSPAEFGVGSHTITYIYTYQKGAKVAKQQCLVKIDIAACQCPGVERVNAELPAGKTEAFVSWHIPKPNCPASLTSVSPPSARNGRGSYPIGKYSVIYNYRHSSESGSFTMSCSVEITIKGKLCAGVGFNTESQVCCCGTVHNRRPSYECCGPKYYDTRDQQCDDYYTLVDRSNISS